MVVADSRVRIAGVDLGKRTFQVHLTDEFGAPLAKHRLARDELLAFFSTLPQVTVAMEACSGAHYWAAAMQSQGHRALLLSPRAVAKLRTGPKNDANDAALIAMAARLPELRPVPWKSQEQLAVLSMHRVRDFMRRQKVATSNHVLGLLGEFGLLPFGNMAALLRADDVTLGEALQPLPPSAREAIGTSVRSLHDLFREERAVDKAIRVWHSSNPASQRAATVPGVGYLTATAVAACFNGAAFTSGRQFAASLGLVPIQYSTGGVQRLGHIGRGGDAYLRRLLVSAALGAMMRVSRDGSGPACLVDLLKRKPRKVVACAHANRLARTTWAVIASGGEFEARTQWAPIAYVPPLRRRIRVAEGAE